MDIEWTHKGVRITDIRKVKKFYIISIEDKKITSPLFVEHSIFEGRVNSYYLRGYNSLSSSAIQNTEITRDEVVDVKWNMVIYKGFFVKYSSNGEIEKYNKDENKFYISFLEIDGPLGSHISN